MKYSLYTVHIEHNQVFIGGLNAGFIFTDSETPGTFLELRGAVCKRFRDRNNLVLWLLKNAERYFPQVREHLLSKVRRAA